MSSRSRLIPLPVVVAAAIATLMVAGSARAATTTITGTIKFYQNLGNYCPAGRDCTGWNYLESAYHTMQPVPNTPVMVLDNTGEDAMNGITDSNGHFSLTGNLHTGTTRVQFLWFFADPNGRFEVRDGNGAGGFVNITKNVTNGGTNNFGTISWGSAGNPSALANVYNAAWRTWTYAFSTANILLANFTNVQIRAFNTSCPLNTSCANAKLVNLDTNAVTPYAYSARTAHELGHIASDLSSQQLDQNGCGNYTRDGVAGWNMQSAEWACGAFEEGFATFLGDISRFSSPSAWPGADWCFFEMGACANGLLETSSNVSVPTSCVANQERWAMSTEKFFWDAFDNHNESGNTGFNETNQVSYASLLDNNKNFAVGTGNRQRDEWQALPADLDGRSVTDYRANYLAAYGVDLSVSSFVNCYLPGD